MQVRIYSVLPGDNLTLNRILMYFPKDFVFSNKLRLIMQKFVHFQEKRPFSQLTFAKNTGETGMLVEKFYFRSTLKTSASKFPFLFLSEEVLTPTSKWGWWIYFPYIVLVH